MSAFNDLNIECENCGEEFRGTVWTAIHAKQDPELKDLLLGGEINLIMCPDCGQVAFHDHFLIYQDPEIELIAYVYPETQASEREVLEKEMKRGFSEAQAVFETKDRFTYEPILVFGLESLVEMLHSETEEGEQYDVAEAVCKEKHIPYVTLRPSESRRLSLPRVLPHTASSKNPSRADVIAGLEKLIQVDPALDLYKTLLENVRANSSWAL
jgi:hypothetical protein